MTATSPLFGVDSASVTRTVLPNGLKVLIKSDFSAPVGEIAKQTKAVGGYLNAATIYDHTSYYTVLPATGFRQGLEVQADAYANSLIDSEELARELEVII